MRRISEIFGKIENVIGHSLVGKAIHFHGTEHTILLLSFDDSVSEFMVPYNPDEPGKNTITLEELFKHHEIGEEWAGIPVSLFDKDLPTVRK